MELLQRLCNHIATDKRLRHYADRLTHGQGAEITQQIALIVCELPIEKQAAIEPHFNFWCVRTAQILAAKFNRERLGTEPLPDIPDTQPTPEITPDLSTLYWYDREIFLLYADLGSARAVARKVGLHAPHVAEVVKRVRLTLAHDIHRSL